MNFLKDFNPLSAEIAKLQEATLLNKTDCIYKCGAESHYYQEMADMCTCNMTRIFGHGSIQSFGLKRFSKTPSSAKTRRRSSGSSAEHSKSKAEWKSVFSLTHDAEKSVYCRRSTSSGTGWLRLRGGRHPVVQWSRNWCAPWSTINTCYSAVNPNLFINADR